MKIIVIIPFFLALFFAACSTPEVANVEEAINAEIEPLASEPTSAIIPETDQALDILPPADSVVVADKVVEEHMDLSDDSWEPDMDMMYTGREFMIILSTKSFESAKSRAIEAAEKLQLEIRIDGLHEVDGHLSWTESECDGNGYDYPCYVARGRYDEGNYVSIEQSDAYDGFTRGYYIVVVSSGAKGETSKDNFLTSVKAFYDDAYVKSTKVYMGCMH